jgi:hypothetical protein
MKDGTQVIVILAIIIAGFAAYQYLETHPAQSLFNFSFNLPTGQSSQQGSSTTNYYTTEQTVRANLADLFMPLIMLGDPIGTCQLLGGHWFESPIKVGCFGTTIPINLSETCDTAAYQTAMHQCMVVGAAAICDLHNIGCYY